MYKKVVWTAVIDEENRKRRETLQNPSSEAENLTQIAVWRLFGENEWSQDEAGDLQWNPEIVHNYRILCEIGCHSPAKEGRNRGTK